MSDQSYHIHYQSRDDVVFPSRKGMETYLRNERDSWAPILDYLRDNLKNPITNNNRANWTPDIIAASIDTLSEQLSERNNFNQATAHQHRRLPLPPPSGSLEGQLIDGLVNAGYMEEALACLVYTFAKDVSITHGNNDRIHRLIVRGKALVDAAPIVVALPYSKVSTAKMAAAVRTANNHVQAMADEIESVQELHAQHHEDLDEHLETQKSKSKRINDIVLRLNKRRDRRQKLWVQGTEQMIAEAFSDAEKKVRLFEVKSRRAEEERVKQFKHLQDLFATQLRLRAPVKLWEGRETSHSTNSAKAMQRFVGIGALAILFGLAVPFLAGDYIASSFYEILCQIPAIDGTAATATNPAIPASPATDCERVFSAKGPVTVTGLLLVTSLLLWFARLQYRVHLSERHLALDASEKKAFAETYLAMKEGKDVGKDNEAIILGSLFRPTQDGIIKDDGTGMDISAAAILAKQLGKPN
jgi:hypothetical protein